MLPLITVPLEKKNGSQSCCFRFRFRSQFKTEKLSGNYLPPTPPPPRGGGSGGGGGEPLPPPPRPPPRPPRRPPPQPRTKKNKMMR